MILMFFLFTLLMAAIIVYIVLVRRKDRSKGTNAAAASDMSWLNALIDKLDNLC